MILGLVCIDFFDHLPLNLLLILFSGLGAAELCNIFEKKNPAHPRPLLISLSIAVVVSAYINALILHGNESNNTNAWLITDISFIFAEMFVFAYEIFSAKTFKSSNSKLTDSAFLIFYTGYLPTFIVRLSNENNSDQYIAVFLILVFITDSAAWLFGMLFGKNNRGKIAASPNKSIAGFIGGYAGCIVFTFIMAFIFKSCFQSEHKLQSLLLLGFAVCTASIIGDLAESVLKRSAGVKDSGSIIMGRGGVLDSIDSILAAAPVYYALIKLMFTAK